MRSREIRETFLNFFAAHAHRIVPSSSLVPDDPTMLLTTAGMVQFKPIFAGAVKADFTRAASCQKCLRTTDIERVGHTARHHTFFEMLGNFSFGDYYKKEACEWAWELVTGAYGMDVDRLWVTIFREDDEAEAIWRDVVGIAPERIVRLGEEDNFWSAGPTGPCGPSSEIIYDLGLERGCGPDCTVGCDCDRWLEIWNLVFTECDRDEEGNLHPLPKKNIDTGAGLERIASVLQGTRTNFETDQIRPLVDKAQELSGRVYGASDADDVSMRILADHARAVTFLISDGVLPSNEGRGYVLRRLIRRAVRHGRLLGVEEAFITKMTDLVVDVMREPYPEVGEHQELVRHVASNEEERFAVTLRQGLSLLEETIDALKSQRENVLDGATAFRLYDTYGFPLELTREIASESGIGLDEAGFGREMQAQRERARIAREEQQLTMPAEALSKIQAAAGETEFVGYAEDEACGRIVGIVLSGEEAIAAATGDDVEVVLDRTPFYAEKGGQVGDAGTLTGPEGKVEISVTREPIEGLYVHSGKVIEGSVSVGDEVAAKINLERRRSVERNHTATHLLHWALRVILGKHVKQSGSLVEPHRLRFDFSHFAQVTPDDVRRVELLANTKILESHPVRAFTTSIAFARDSGAVALFGEKYGEFVRVLEIGNFSKELCGGTHVGDTSEIGLIRIVSEGSVGANLRRVEAVTGVDALHYGYGREDILSLAASLLKVREEEVPSRVETMLGDLKKKDELLRTARATSLADQASEVMGQAKTLDGYRAVVTRVAAGRPDEMRNMVDILRAKLGGKGIVVLGGESEGKAMLVVAATPDVVEAGFDSVALVRHIAPHISGGGGGRADLAQAGGKNPEGLDVALREAWKWLQQAQLAQRGAT
ncbi:MAG: alanine--tRNA ligase [Actinobacteria bacterium]|nr:MAG: alanine--tRNA ligase [Actinomycetota bacterium]